MDEIGSEQEPVQRYEAVQSPVSIDTGTGTLEVVFTTSARDRQGDVVDPAGLNFAGFLKNPVVLWAHDQERPPIARVRSVSVQDTDVSAVVEFAATPFAQEVFSLYAEGFLSAWSIGFIAQETEPLEGGGVHVLQAEVVEISAVPVPANPEALTKHLPFVRSRDLRHVLRAASTGGVTQKSGKRTLTVDELVQMADDVITKQVAQTVNRLLLCGRGGVPPHPCLASMY